jgi:predicted nucleic acid-binding protein
MVILDTNIFIYLSNGTLSRHIVASTDIANASTTKVEALGFSSIPANELLLLDALFGESYNLALTDSIIERAIKLRQGRRMSLGDSIIAATALEHNLTLWTANIDDFHYIEGLKVLNPLRQQ